MSLPSPSSSRVEFAGTCNHRRLHSPSPQTSQYLAWCPSWVESVITERRKQYIMERSRLLILRSWHLMLWSSISVQIQRFELSIQELENWVSVIWPVNNLPKVWQSNNCNCKILLRKRLAQKSDIWGLERQKGQIYHTRWIAITRHAKSYATRLFVCLHLCWSRGKHGKSLQEAPKVGDILLESVDSIKASKRVSK